MSAPLSHDRHRRAVGLAGEEHQQHLPAKVIDTLPGGSQLVQLHESGGTCHNNVHAGQPTATLTT
jgi:hypothetical protein